MKTCSIKKEQLNRIIFFLANAIYFLLLLFLFYKQLVSAGTFYYESDTAKHVEFAVKDGYFYSLSSFIYAFLNFFPGLNYTVPVLLSAFTVGSVYLTRSLLLNLFTDSEISVSEWALDVFSFSLNFVSGFYLSAANKQHYIGYQSGNMWHNSTYIFMRFFALATLIYYFKLKDTYKDGITVRQWLSITALLAVATGFKPSFLTVFAPFLLVKLIYDWINGTKFINIFKLGTCVFIPIFIMFLESMVLFSEEAESGYTIAPFKALSLRGDHPKVTLVLSIMFPIVVFLFNIKKLRKDKLYLGSLIIWLIGFLEVFLLIETGERAKDSNFFWGYSIALFIVFAASVYRAWRSFVESEGRYRYAVLSVEAVVFTWHVVSGIWYFVLLLQGYTYFA